IASCRTSPGFRGGAPLPRFHPRGFSSISSRLQVQEQGVTTHTSTQRRRTFSDPTEDTSEGFSEAALASANAALSHLDSCFGRAASAPTTCLSSRSTTAFSSHQSHENADAIRNEISSPSRSTPDDHKATRHIAS
ncbi:unnamed protein product, partial [Amoebophrya sp. A25]